MTRAKDISRLITDADFAGTLTVGDLTASSLNGGQFGGRRNIVINGAMQVAQRGTSASSVTASQYLCDRWEYETIGEETVTISQTTDAPSGFPNSFKVDITTADSDLIASDYAVVKQVIEAQNLQHLKYGSSDAETITLSFHVKSSVTGIYAVGLEHGETTSYHSQTYSISSANTWEKKTVTFTGNTATAINNDNGGGLHVNFPLSAGTSYTTGSNGAWGAITNWLANHAVNVIGTVNATFFITGVQLEVGSVATPFEHRSFGEELALCQRYYYRRTNPSTYLHFAIAYATTDIQGGAFHPVQMRASPTLSFDGVLKASQGNAEISSSSGFSFTSYSTNDSLGFYTTGTPFTGLTQFRGYMISNDTDDYMEVNSEL